MITLDAAIKHCEEVAEEQEDFEKFQCKYCKLGWEDGVWKETCRLPSNVPQGYSWSECSEQNCPLFYVCLECASEHRQIAEYLKELKYYKNCQDLINKNWQELIRYREGIEKIKMRSQAYRERGENILASGMEQALDILEVNADEEGSEIE